MPGFALLTSLPRVSPRRLQVRPNIFLLLQMGQYAQFKRILRPPTHHLTHHKQMSLMQHLSFKPFKPTLQRAFVLYSGVIGCVFLGLAALLGWELYTHNSLQLPSLLLSADNPAITNPGTLDHISITPLVLLGAMVVIFVSTLISALVGMRRYILRPMHNLMSTVPCIKSDRTALQEHSSFVYEFADLAHSLQELGKCYIGKSYYADALHNSEEQLHLILEDSPTGFAIIKPSDGAILLVNKRFSQLSGIAAKAGLKESQHNNLTQSRLGRTILKKLQTTALHDSEIHFVPTRANDREMWLHLNSHPIDFFDQVAVLVWLSDLTDVRLISDHLQRKNALLELLYATTATANESSSTDEVVISTLERICAYTGWETGHIFEVREGAPTQLVSANKWSCGAFDSDLAIWREETMTSVFDLGQGLPGLAAIAGKPVSINDMRQEPDTQRGPVARYVGIVSGVAIPIHANGELVAVAEFTAKHPINLESNLEKALMQIADQMGQVFLRGKLESEVREAMKATDKANEAKSQFLANMSHELRTPLNAIIGFSDTMKHHVFGNLGNEKHDEYVTYIYSSGIHLLNLIDAILDISKIEANKMVLNTEPVDIGEVIEGALNIVIHRAQDKGVHLHVDMPPALPLMQLDPLKVKQTMINILTNAIKFTPSNGDVHIHSCVAENGDVVIKVEDTGVGIAPDQIEHALLPFVQTDSGRLSGEGTGLGLPISKHFMKMHDGKLIIDSKENKGTCVTLIFPKERILDDVDGSTLTP